MDRYRIAVIPATLFLAVACMTTTENKSAPDKSAAQTSPAPGAGGRPNLVASDVARTTALVEAIDRQHRILTLRNADGDVRTLAVDPSVGNFDQIERGDKVQTEYLESVAIYVEVPGSVPDPAGAAGSAHAVEVAPKGEKPSGVMVDTVESRATIKDIDYVNRLVTLSDSEGDAQTIRVDPRAGDVTSIRVGDQILIRQTRSIAIAVTKAP